MWYPRVYAVFLVMFFFFFFVLNQLEPSMKLPAPIPALYPVYCVEDIICAPTQLMPKPTVQVVTKEYTEEI